MHLDLVTITGADDNVDVSELLKLANKFPFVEWGILFSKKNEGSSRYPSEDWRESVEHTALNLSAHLCGWYSLEVIEHKNFEIISRLPARYKRVQLNYSFNRIWDYYDHLQELCLYAKAHPERSIIFQYNQQNKKCLDVFVDSFSLPDNIHFLYDESGGHGKPLDLTSIGHVAEKYFGYAGGINASNIEMVIRAIENSRLEKATWIDVETGVRNSDGAFDLHKVEVILAICRTHTP